MSAVKIKVGEEKRPHILQTCIQILVVLVLGRGGQTSASVVRWQKLGTAAKLAAFTA